MNIPPMLRKLVEDVKMPEMILMGLFVVYFVFPISTPLALVPWIDSPIGLVILFVIAVSLFLHMAPIVGILFLLVAYELLRRNHYTAPASPIPEATQYLANRVPQSTVTQSEKNSDLKQLNPPQPKSLEEEMVSQSSPHVNQSPDVFVPNTYLPLADKSSLGASLF